MVSSNASIKALTEQYCLGTYPERDIALVRGRGAYVWDADGKRYLDCLCGIGVNNLGHCHPAVVEAVQKQAETLMHVSNVYLIEPQAQLARLLCENTFATKVFFANSGAEVIEGALKLARKYARKKGYAHRFGFISLLHSFHGRTYGAVTATGQEKYHKDFEPMLPGFCYVPLNDLEAARAAVKEDTCAILVEPIQGEGGIRIAEDAYLQGLRELCDKRDLLLIFDEVQCGNGRTGKLYAYMHSGVVPDVMVTAKGLGGGVPIGALLVGPKCEAVFEPGNHATTFGGNPLATAAGVAAVRALLEEGLIERAEELGKRMLERLRAIQQQVKGVREVRGRGLMIGVELDRPALPIIGEMMRRGFLIGRAGENVLRFLPPLVIEWDDLDALLHHLQEVLLS